MSNFQWYIGEKLLSLDFRDEKTFLRKDKINSLSVSKGYVEIGVLGDESFLNFDCPKDQADRFYSECSKLLSIEESDEQEIISDTYVSGDDESTEWRIKDGVLSFKTEESMEFKIGSIRLNSIAGAGREYPSSVRVLHDAGRTRIYFYEGDEADELYDVLKSIFLGEGGKPSWSFGENND